jgi:hypothetical protein
MSKDEVLELALEVLVSSTGELHRHLASPNDYQLVKNHRAIAAIKAALEAKDEPVGLIESLKDAQPCCGQYETCWRACTPRGKFIGRRDAQRKPLTDDEIQDALEAEFLGSDLKRNWQDDLRVARAIEAAHGIKGEA